MNHVALTGRLTRDAVTRYGGPENSAVSRFTLAVDRVGEGTDFINCVAFGKNGEFFEKYGKKGTKFIVEGRVQSGTYERNGERVYTMDVVIERKEFAESKKADNQPQTNSDGFMSIPDGEEDFMPFN